MMGFLFLNPIACQKANEYGKSFAEAYLFAKHLGSLNKHPIILNFKANTAAIRLLTGYTDRKFKQLLNDAITYRMASYEGNNLRLIGKTQEQQLFNIKRKKHKRTDYYNVPNDIKTIKAFYQIQVLNKNVQAQAVQISKKPSTTNIVGGLLSEGNKDRTTMGYRKISTLLQTSISKAHALAKSLSNFGLCLSQNRQSISKEQYKAYRAIGYAKSVRYNQHTNEHLFVGANFISIKPVFEKLMPIQIKTEHYLSLYIG